MLSFIFPNECHSSDHLVEGLQHKIREYTNSTHVIINRLSSVEKWEITHGKKTSKIASFNFSKTFGQHGILIPSPEEKEFLWCRHDRKIQIWDSDLKYKSQIETRNTFKSSGIVAINDDYNTQVITCMKFYKDSVSKKHFLIIGFNTNEIQVWDWETKKKVHTFFKKNGHETFSLVVNEKTRELICANSVSFEIWCLGTFTYLKGFQNTSINFWVSVCFLDNIKHLIGIFDSRGTFKTWDRLLEKCMTTKENSYSVCGNEMIYHPNSGLIITCGDDDQHQVKFWKLCITVFREMFAYKVSLDLDFQLENPFKCPVNTVKELDSGENSHLLVAGGKDGSLFIIDINKKQVTWERKYEQNEQGGILKIECFPNVK